MRLSKMQLKTLREVPGPKLRYQVHILMLRTGMIRKLASGVIRLHAIGLEDPQKDRRDSERRDGRGRRAGKYTCRLYSRQSCGRNREDGMLTRARRAVAYKGQACAVIFVWDLHMRRSSTDIARNDISSYRQLPMNLYQIQTKYRDEARPRFGLMRSREFIMKDAYSFDRDQAGLDKSYDEMYAAYEKIFTRCGLDFRPVEGGHGSHRRKQFHEFTALSEVGESEIAYCEKCSIGGDCGAGRVC